MLKTMRNSFHHLKWTLFLVIAVFILGFVFFSGGSDPDRRLETGRRARRQGADHRGRVRPAVPGPGGALSADVPGQLLARARAGARSAAQRARLDDRADAPARVGPPHEPLRLRRGARSEDRDAPLLPGERPVHRAREVRTDAPRQRPRARAFEERGPRGHAAPEVRRSSSRRRSSCPSRRSCASTRPRTTRPRSSTSSFPPAASRARRSRRMRISSSISTSTRTATARPCSAGSSTCSSTRPRSARR